jgi:hypothetical protein
MSAPEAPIEITRRTNSPRVIWQFTDAAGVPDNLAGLKWDLVISWAKGVIKHASDPDLGDTVLEVDLDLGQVIYPYSLEESVEVPNSGAKYELFYTIGTAREMACGGPVKVIGFIP